MKYGFELQPAELEYLFRKKTVMELKQNVTVFKQTLDHLILQLQKQFFRRCRRCGLIVSKQLVPLCTQECEHEFKEISEVV